MRGKITMKTEWSNGLKLSARVDINQFNDMYNKGLLDLLYKTSPVYNFDIKNVQNISISIRANQGQYKYNYDIASIGNLTSLDRLYVMSINIVESLRQWSKSPYNFVSRQIEG